jgi:isopenicillin-N epimerase
MPEGQTLAGSEVRALWPLPAGLTYLNHGGYGLTPKSVLRVQSRLKAEMERDPSQFVDVLEPRLLEARKAAAEALGASVDDLVFVENATTGVNAVLQSLVLPAGAEILCIDHIYPAVRNALRHKLNCVGGGLVEVPLPWPIASDEEIVAAVERAFTPRTALAVFDLIASHTAIRFPIERLTALARARNVPVLGDAAHAPGQIPLDLPALGADWVTGNLHKWYFAPRGCAVLWVRTERQSRLHPTVISHGYGGGIAAEFNWTGTRDLTAWLSAPAGIAFHNSLGGKALMERNRRLAADAASLLSDAWQTEVAGLPEQRAAMASVRVPKVAAGAIAEFGRLLHDRLLNKHRIQVPLFTIKGALWLRISAQAYNEISDYHRLAEAVLEEVPGLDK